MDSCQGQPGSWAPTSPSPIGRREFSGDLRRVRELAVIASIALSQLLATVPCIGQIKPLFPGNAEVQPQRTPRFSWLDGIRESFEIPEQEIFPEPELLNAGSKSLETAPRLPSSVPEPYRLMQPPKSLRLPPTERTGLPLPPLGQQKKPSLLERLLQPKPFGRWQAEYRFENENFVLKTPSREWVRAPIVEDLSPDVSVALAIPEKEMYIQIIAEKIGTQAGFDTNWLCRIARTAMASKAPGIDISEPRPFQIAGLQGLRFTASADTAPMTGRMSLDWINWCCVHNGVGYQISTWTIPRNLAALYQTWRDIPDCFQLIDPQLRIDTGSQIRVQLASDQFGVSADLTGCGLMVLTSEDVGPAAPSELMATSGDDSILLVVPYSVPDGVAARKHLTEAVLAQSSVDLEHARLNTCSVTHGQLPAIDYIEPAHVGAAESTRYFRICYGPNCLWAVLFATDPDDQYATEKWRQILTKLQLTPPASISMSSLSKAQRERHITLYLTAALASLSEGRQGVTKGYCSLAHQLAPDDLSVREQVVDILIETRDFESLLPLLEPLPPGLAIDPVRRAQLAWTLAEVGRVEEATQMLDELFQTDFYDEDYLELFLDLLRHDDRHQDAL